MGANQSDPRWYSPAGGNDPEYPEYQKMSGPWKKQMRRHVAHVREQNERQIFGPGWETMDDIKDTNPYATTGYSNHCLSREDGY